MYSIKYQSRNKIKQLQMIEKMITAEEEKIRLLKIDLEYLSRPQHIRQFLIFIPHLEPIKPSQVIIIKSKDLL